MKESEKWGLVTRSRLLEMYLGRINLSLTLSAHSLSAFMLSCGEPHMLYTLYLPSFKFKVMELDAHVLKLLKCEPNEPFCLLY